MRRDVCFENHVVKSLIQTVKMLFGSITQERLAYLNFDAIFEFLGQFTKMNLLFFNKNVDNFEIEHKKC